MAVKEHLARGIAELATVTFPHLHCSVYGFFFPVLIVLPNVLSLCTNVHLINKTCSYQIQSFLFLQTLYLSAPGIDEPVAQLLLIQACAHHQLVLFERVGVWVVQVVVQPPQQYVGGFLEQVVARLALMRFVRRVVVLFHLGGSVYLLVLVVLGAGWRRRGRWRWRWWRFLCREGLAVVVVVLGRLGVVAHQRRQQRLWVVVGGRLVDEYVADGGQADPLMGVVDDVVQVHVSFNTGLKFWDCKIGFEYEDVVQFYTHLARLEIFFVLCQVIERKYLVIQILGLLSPGPVYTCYFLHADDPCGPDCKPILGRRFKKCQFDTA